MDRAAEAAAAEEAACRCVIGRAGSGGSTSIRLCVRVAQFHHQHPNDGIAAAEGEKEQNH